MSESSSNTYISVATISCIELEELNRAVSTFQKKITSWKIYLWNIFAHKYRSSVKSKIFSQGLSSKWFAKLSHSSKWLHSQKNTFNCYTSKSWKAHSYIISIRDSLPLIFHCLWKKSESQFQFCPCIEHWRIPVKNYIWKGFRWKPKVIIQSQECCPGTNKVLQALEEVFFCLDIFFFQASESHRKKY